MGALAMTMMVVVVVATTAQRNSADEDEGPTQWCEEPTTTRGN